MANTNQANQKMSQQVTPEKILETAAAFAPAKALLAAVELGIFTELAQGPLELQALTERLELHPRGARDYLDLLVALHFLDRQDGKYSNAPDTDLFLDRKKPSYIGGFLELMNARTYPLWMSLGNGLRTGKLQNEAKEQNSDDAFGSMYADPGVARSFLRGMTGMSKPVALAIATTFPWQNYKTVLDVGAAQGGCVVQIVQAHHHITGGGFDLPSVQPYFEEYITQCGLQDRLRFFAGDFFEVDLPPADVLIMGQILHDWDLIHKQILLKKAYDALPAGGALIVYDALIDEGRRKNVFALIVSMTMLLDTSGGFNYTGTDCVSWMQAAGFSKTSIENLSGPYSMVVGIK
jgi:hypothetical protein